MKTSGYLSIAVGLLVVGGLLAEGALAGTTTSPAAALKKKITIDFVELPLEDALNYLRTAADINIVLANRELRDKTVTLELKDVSVETVLKWVVKQTETDYSVQDGVVYVGSHETVKVGPVLVMYDVTDLLYQERLRAASADPPKALKPGDTVLVQVPEGKSLEELAADLIAFVKTTTGEDTWKDSTKATMAYFAGKLVVNADPDVQVKVATILAGLRK